MFKYDITQKEGDMSLKFFTNTFVMKVAKRFFCKNYFYENSALLSTFLIKLPEI